MKKLAISTLLLLSLCGCATYSKSSKVFPDSFNITDYRAMGQPVRNDVIGIGFSWSLK